MGPCVVLTGNTLVIRHVFCPYPETLIDLIRWLFRGIDWRYFENYTEFGSIDAKVHGCCLGFNPFMINIDKFELLIYYMRVMFLHLLFWKIFIHLLFATPRPPFDDDDFSCRCLVFVCWVMAKLKVMGFREHASILHITHWIKIAVAGFYFPKELLFILLLIR